MTTQRYFASTQLDHLEVIHVELLEKPEGRHPEIYVELDFEPLRAEDSSDEKLGLRVHLEINKRRRDVKLRGVLEVIASFSFEEALDEKQRIQLLLFNGLATVYSLLRGIVFQKASSLSPSFRLLPMINVVQLVNDKKKQMATNQEHQ